MTQPHDPDRPGMDPTIGECLICGHDLTYVVVGGNRVPRCPIHGSAGLNPKVLESEQSS